MSPLYQCVFIIDLNKIHNIISKDKTKINIFIRNIYERYYTDEDVVSETLVELNANRSNFDELLEKTIEIVISKVWKDGWYRIFAPQWTNDSNGYFKLFEINKDTVSVYDFS